jgi:hypothetical protein
LSYTLLATFSPSELIVTHSSQLGLLRLVGVLGCVTQRTQLLVRVDQFLVIVASVGDAFVEVLANIILVGG